MAVESGVAKVVAEKAASKAAASTAAKGGLLKSIGTTTLVVATSPFFGFIALAGVVGWQLWKAKKDEAELTAQKAIAQG